MFDKEFLERKIKDAELVLIGIGEEFEGSKLLHKDIRYLQMEEELKNNIIRSLV